MGWLARTSEMPDLRPDRVVPLPGAPVEVQVMGRGTLDVLLARNVSATGLGVFVPHGFKGFDLSDEVELVVTLPRDQPFLALGQIKHVTSDIDDAQHFGLFFTSMGERHREALVRYVHSRLDRES